MKNDNKKYEKGNFTCFICSKRGHKAIQCWHNPANRSETETTNQKGNNYNKRQNNPSFTQKTKIAEAKYNERDINETIPKTFKTEDKNHETHKNEWILDSGATSHMVSEIEYINEPIEEKKKLN